MSASDSMLRRGFSHAWEHRWAFAVPVATLLLPATLYVVHLPDVFKATGTVSVRVTRAPNLGSAVPQEEESRTDAALASARDHLLQKKNVEAMLPVLKPAKTPDDPDGTSAAKRAVTYEQMPSESGFKVSVENKSAEVAAAAVNALLKAFLEAERQEKIGGLHTTLVIQQGEVARTKAEYQEADAAVAAFRAAHSESMPDLKDGLVSEMARVESQLRDREAAGANARRIGQEYEKLMRQTQPEARLPGQPVMSAEEEQLTLQLRGAQNALDLAKKDLGAAQSRYQDKHPTVVQLLAEVARLETDVSKSRDELASAHQRAESQASERHGSEARPWLESLQQIRASVTEEESRANQEGETLRARAAKIQARLDAVPATEKALDPLRKSSLRAEAAWTSAQAEYEKLDKLEKFYRSGDDRSATSFRVDEWAVPPAAPSGPGRQRILLTAMAAGLLLGYGFLALNRRSGDGAVVRPEDLADLVPEALVVRVPALDGASAALRRSARWKNAGLALYVALCLTVSGLALAAHKGYIDPPPWFKSFLGNSRAA